MLALMSKPMAVTLPILLVILDLICRYEGGLLRSNRTLLLDKLPFILLSLTVVMATLLAQQQAGAVSTLNDLSLATRFFNSVHKQSILCIQMADALSPLAVLSVSTRIKLTDAASLG